MLKFSFNIDPKFNQKISDELYLKLSNCIKGQYSCNEKYLYLESDNGEKIAGVIFSIFNKILWIDSIFVEESCQNQGFGSILLNELIKFAKENNIEKIQLNTYFNDSLKFFEKFGFKKVSEISNWKYNLTCYFLQLIIFYD